MGCLPPYPSGTAAAMTDRVASLLAALVVAAALADAALNDAGALTFLAREGLGLLRWLAFWR